MPEDVLKKELQQMGGMPKEIMDDQEIFDFFSPMIRADFEIIEKYKNHKPVSKINVPIYTMMGDQEELASKIRSWRQFTTYRYYEDIVTGDHFFYKKDATPVANMITQAYQDNL